MDFNDMSFEWRLENQPQVAVQVKEEVVSRRTGVRMFYCRNLFKAFGYSNRSAETAIRIEQVLGDHGMQVEPSIQCGPDGFGISTTDWVRISLSHTVNSSGYKAFSLTFPDGVVTAGSGPYTEDDFDEILDRKGIIVDGLGVSEKEVLILGRHDWDEDELDEHIEAHRGSKLRVYSQEMFLAYLVTDKDPYDDCELLKGFGDGHPVFDYLSEWGFDWPHTRIVPGRSIMGTVNSDPASWPSVGLLKYLGYSVGANGVSRSKRQIILRDAFIHSVPNVQSLDYMAGWGLPSSNTRLLKLANSIASFAKNAKRRTSPHEEAIQDWESDLAWLKETFYHGRYRFSWPSTDVH